MKIPLGIFLGNNELAEGVILVAPLEIRPHIRFPAGTVLYKKDAGTAEQQPLDKIKQVFEKLKERCVKAQNSKVFMDAMEPMEKENVLYFNQEHELVEQHVVFVNVAHSDNLTWPDGRLWKLISTLYPLRYPEPDGRAKYTEIVQLLETNRIQFLNDVSLIYNEAFLVEHGTILDRAKYIGLREKMDRIGKPMKKTDVFDATSDGKFICSRPLYSYTKKFLLPANTLVTDDMWNMPEIQEMINGDPLLIYRKPDSRQGIYVAHNDIIVAGKLKDFLKTNYFKVVGESMNKAETLKSVASLRPKFLFLGPLSQDTDIDMSLIESVMNDGGAGQLNNVNLTIFAFLNEKTAAVENNLRSAGVTFIFVKDDVLNNFSAFAQRIKGTMEMFRL